LTVQHDFDVTIIGAGIAGIATAYYLSRAKKIRLGLVDALPVMSFTSAQSGDNFRNWWPHPVMTDFMNHSIDLMEEVAKAADNRINMKHGGYLLATRNPSIHRYLETLESASVAANEAAVRIHDGSINNYQASLGKPTTGVDILTNSKSIRTIYPHLDQRIKNIIHIRRAGDISGQQLGQTMLDAIREGNGHLVRGQVTGIETGQGFLIRLDNGQSIRTERLVLAAGPFINQLLNGLDEQLPMINVLQQKLAFADERHAVPRNQPFVVDLDPQQLDWTDEERDMIAGDVVYQRLAVELPGGVHCRPEGGRHGEWVKLGWAFNRTASEPDWSPALDDFFPEIVLRGAARLNPGLKRYYEALPVKRSHYGGYYTMTEENWPIIGPLATPDAFVVGALSGFGSMAACAAGSLCANWVMGKGLPDYAGVLSLQRYSDDSLMEELRALNETGSL